MSRSGKLPDVFVALAALVFTSGLVAAELSPPERSTVLQQLQNLRKKNPALQAEFVEEKTTHLLNEPIKSAGTMAFSVPNKFRRDQKGANPSTTICNGKTMWIFYPNFNEVEIYTLGQRAFFDDALSALTAGLNFDAVEEYYKLQAFRDGDGYRFVLAPKHSNLKKLIEQIAVWLDPKLDPVRTDVTLPKGDRLVTTYKNARRTTLPDALFEFTPPPGAHISHPLGK